MNICFVCGEDLQLCWPGDPTQYDGTHFTAHGNYGSGVFDPLGTASFLKMSVCDGCMLGRKDRVVLVAVRQPPTEYTTSAWQPEEDL